MSDKAEILLGKSKAKDKDKLAGRFRKRPRNIKSMINIYNVLCGSCKINTRLAVERGEIINPTDFCEECQEKVIPLLNKVKGRLEK